MNQQDISAQVELLRRIGFESRTLLNGITGPIHLLRSMISDPALLETLHILDLSTVRFEKFSLRSQLLANLLNPASTLHSETCDLADLVNHAVLELNDFINFYGITISIAHSTVSLIVDANRDLVYQSVMISFEQFMGVLETGSTINVNIENNHIRISAPDKGFFAQKFEQTTDNWSNDLDIVLLKKTFEKFNIHFSINVIDSSSILTFG